jgi:hypothetical protein
MLPNILDKRKEQGHPIMVCHNWHRLKGKRRGGICEERMEGRGIVSWSSSQLDEGECHYAHVSLLGHVGLTMIYEKNCTCPEP